MLRSHTVPYSDLQNAPLGCVRKTLRDNAYTGPTAGLCDGRLQCNLVILPEQDAKDFQTFCKANPVYCPLLGVSKPGIPHIPHLGTNMDLRTDVPLFFIYRPGQVVARQEDITALWQDDFVGFAVGCSFTFEYALMRAGIEMRHIDEGVTVPMYRSTLPTVSAGKFGGPAVVSMRPIPKNKVDEVMKVCEAFPHAHGIPIHVGDPSQIGIDAINHPDWGQPVSFRDGEVPVFWGCGVTTQVALNQAQPSIAITHAPGAMLITDADETIPPEWPRSEP